MAAKESVLPLGKTSKIILRKSPFKRVLESWVEIDATVEEAWTALLDFESWSQWNSFIPMVKGELKVGQKMQIKVQSPGLKEMIFEPIVFEVENPQKLVWGGGSPLIGYQGSHAFIIEPVNEHTLVFRQIETFQGVIVLFMKKMIAKTALGYVNMNEEFKTYLEGKQ